MPEEKYRTTIDHLADVIYAYFDEYKKQGLLEGLEADRIIVTGNPIVDVLEEYFLSGKIRLNDKELTEYKNSLDIHSQSYWVMTAHRRENVESQNALTEILNLAGSVKDKVIFPAGYRTQQQINRFDIAVPKNVKLMDPIGYIELLELVMGCTGILTDSGTLVEEAAVLGIPAIQMRTSTERPQVYDTGGCIKFDPHQDHTEDDRQKLIAATKLRKVEMDPHSLGDGQASERIVDDLLYRLSQNDWRGHKPNSKTRPIDRNFGFGLSDRGRV
jgi:UDP-N-acetylglucosamine 2-epimerase (non-hydrolysing)